MSNTYFITSEANFSLPVPEGGGQLLFKDTFFMSIFSFYQNRNYKCSSVICHQPLNQCQKTFLSVKYSRTGFSFTPTVYLLKVIF